MNLMNVGNYEEPEAELPAIAEEEDTPYVPESPANSDSSHPLQAWTEVADVELIFEVGRTKLKWKDMLALEAGQTFTVAPFSELPVQVMVQERCVAIGELVLVDGKASVVLTKVHEGM